MKRIIFLIAVFISLLSCDSECQTLIPGIGGMQKPVITGAPGYDPDAFITEWTVPGGSFTFPLYISAAASYNCIIDWGDGSATSEVTAYNDPDRIHVYSAGTYQISITGSFPWIYVNNGAVKTYLTKVINWGDVGFTNFLSAFYGCSNLSELPDGGITGIIAASPSMYSAFNGCTSLASVPDGLSNNINPSTCERIFFGCTSLTSIPAGLFDYCVNTTSFKRSFQGAGLASIPSGLFDLCVNVTDFDGTFFGCTSLTSIPAGLFNYNDAVTLFQFLFYGCTGLSGSSRELWLNPSGAANYTLSAPSYDSGVPGGRDCYFNCTGLSDYATIPTYWK